MRCLGIDSSLNATGFCLYDGTPSTTLLVTTKTPPHATQFFKKYLQKEMALKLIDKWSPNCLAIEKPFVLPMAGRGRGGEQSSNLFALYSFILMAAYESRLPIAAFHLSQLRSLIHGRAGTTKSDTIASARTELEHPEFGRQGLIVQDDHQADAYFIAKFGRFFWMRFDDLIPERPLKEEAIYSSKEKVSKGRLKGMIFRPEEAWFDFRKVLHAEIPTKWQDNLSRTQSNI